MTFDQFITKWTGKPVDFDGIYPNQCMDLMHQYAYDVLGITDKSILAKAWAALVYTQFAWGNLFEKIANTPTGVPQKGDIILWEEALNYDATIGHGYGHVAVVIDANANTFNSFDANWPLGSLPHVQNHTYTHVLGWLRPHQVATTTSQPTATEYEACRVDRDTNWNCFTALLSKLAIKVNSNDKEGTKNQAITAIENLQTSNAQKDLTIANLNKQIPGLEGQVSTLNNQVLDLTQKLEAAQNQADSGSSFQGLYEQAEIDLKKSRENLEDLQQKYNRTVAQYQSTSVYFVPKTKLLQVFLERIVSK
jgi:uncharacterized coiled-coil protein SlyX